MTVIELHQRIVALGRAYLDNAITLLELHEEASRLRSLFWLPLTVATARLAKR